MDAAEEGKNQVLTNWAEKWNRLGMRKNRMVSEAIILQIRGNIYYDAIVPM